MRRASVFLATSELRYKIRCLQQAFKRAGIGPPAFDNVPAQIAGFNVGVIHIGDLELASPARLQRFDDIEYAVVIHVNAYYRILRFWFRGFLFDPDNAS